MDDMILRDEKPEIDLAINRAIDSYIRSRKEKVPEFSRTFFSGKGSDYLDIYGNFNYTAGCRRIILSNLGRLSFASRLDSSSNASITKF